MNEANPPMAEESPCPECGAPLPANAPGGLCPACLLQQGAAGDTVTGGGAKPFVPPRADELAPLFPQLEIIALIGHGGMGAVYQARQKELDRIVALKILPPGIGDAPGFAERFAREAKALAKLNHPGIVTIHDFGRADGLYFFLMEFVDGLNLRQLLQRGRIAPREALAIVPQICDALQFAHDHGIVHRDIKPENILLDRRGRVKVADFGLAKLVAGVSDPGGGLSEAGYNDASLTEAGKIMGTPSYMAPEQTEHPDEVDHRVDIYALGVVFYQMLTGELPEKQLQPPSRKVHIDVRLDEVVLRALEKEPDLRYQQASIFKTQVETIAGTPPPAPAESPSDQSRAAGDALRKSARGRFTTPEALAKFSGGFFGLVDTGELSLYSNRLVFLSGRQETVIPFAHLHDARIARGPRWLSPAGHAFLLLAYEESGTNRTLLFRPGERFFGLAGETRDVAAEWLMAIGNAMKADGKALPNAPDVPVIVPASPWPALLVLLPLLFVFGSSIWTLMSTPHGSGNTLHLFLVLLTVGPAGFVAMLWLSKRSGAAFPRPRTDPDHGPNRFWRRFAMTVLALIALPIVVSIFAVLAGIIVPKFAARHKPPPASMPAANDTFGPTVEKVITLGNRDDSFLNLSRGAFVPPPDLDPEAANADPANSPLPSQLWKWLTAHEVDLFAQRKDGKPMLAMSDLVTASIDEKDFDRLTPRELAQSEGWRSALDRQFRPSVQSVLRGAFGGKATVAFQTRYDLVGLLQVEGVQGDPAGVRIRYKLVQPARSSGHPAGVRAFTFQPVVERTVTASLDLDSGRLADPPEVVTRKDNIAEAVLSAVGWMEREGMDIFADSRMHCFGVGMRALPHDKKQWESVTAAEVTGTLDASITKVSAYVPLEPLSEQTTFLFQTREGGRGILQMAGATEGGVKIRYRLLEKK